MVGEIENKSQNQIAVIDEFQTVLTNQKATDVIDPKYIQMSKSELLEEIALQKMQISSLKNHLLNDAKKYKTETEQKDNEVKEEYRMVSIPYTLFCRINYKSRICDNENPQFINLIVNNNNSIVGVMYYRETDESENKQGFVMHNLLED